MQCINVYGHYYYSVLNIQYTCLYLYMYTNARILKKETMKVMSSDHFEDREPLVRQRPVFHEGLDVELDAGTLLEEGEALLEKQKSLKQDAKLNAKPKGKAKAKAKSKAAAKAKAAGRTSDGDADGVAVEQVRAFSCNEFYKEPECFLYTAITEVYRYMYVSLLSCMLLPLVYY